MVKYDYAKGRVAETLQFISEEMKEFEIEYASRTWGDYKNDKKLQKLMDRTIENILTALIEVCGTILIEEEITTASYSDVLRKAGKLFKLSEVEEEALAGLAFQRNRLAHRYLNFRWEAITEYVNQKKAIHKLLSAVMDREVKRERSRS